MKKTIKHLASAMAVAVFLVIAFGSDDEETTETPASAKKAETSASVKTIEGTKSCFVGYDWTYPSSSNPTNAWKFSSSGTFNYSTTMFGGMSAWGNWSVTSPGKIKISYTRTTEGTIPGDKTLTMSSCSGLKVGSTVYSKN
tara:strand:+ start:941 stop:1363 length:423 start_codon:yes stop_codon:yes gene_type:complete